MKESVNIPEKKTNKKDKYFYVYFFHNAKPYIPPKRYRICKKKLNDGQIFKKVLNMYLFENYLYLNYLNSLSRISLLSSFSEFIQLLELPSQV